MEKARRFQKNIYFCFIDYAKAFDCEDHNKLWKILKETVTIGSSGVSLSQGSGYLAVEYSANTCIQCCSRHKGDSSKQGKQKPLPLWS